MGTWELVTTDNPIGEGEIQTHRMEVRTGWLYRTTCIRYNDDATWAITASSLVYVPERV